MDLLQRFDDVRPNDLLDDTDRSRLQDWPTNLRSRPPTEASTSPSSNFFSLQLLPLTASKHFWKNVGESGVVAADRDGGKGGIAVQIALVHLRLFTPVTLNLALV
ncbi:hypothetical protein ACFWM0_24465 [Streptomyces sp. NPDC058405]|uniref:hypothetical protein n=1 Tax=Streptomyces sp. NPDC058405 TaxID=3346482 RepID=UPI0036607567